MKKNWLIVIAVVLALILLGLIVKNKFFGKPGPGAISINVNPKSTVFIDDVRVGATPYTSEKIISGEHLVKITAEDSSTGLSSWEGKVNIMPNILTIINRNLGQTESASSGEVFWLEKINSKDKAALVVVSVPDQAVVKIDGVPKGFAPVSLEDLNPGTHQIAVASPGYEERLIPTAKTFAGYKLIINVQLARKIEGIQEATASGQEAETTPVPTAKTTPKITPRATPSPKVTPKPSATPPEKPYVKIKETPTGWLRVRAEPLASAEEVAKVNPGETFPYLDEQKNGWYKIEYETKKEGWVSGTYVELVK